VPAGQKAVSQAVLFEGASAKVRQRTGWIQLFCVSTVSMHFTV
jgi:hypothetical protein